MSTVEFVNKNYDRNILLFINIATVAVLLLIAVLMITTTTGSEWLLLPASWWVGGMMVWGFGKFSTVTRNRG